MKTELPIARTMNEHSSVLIMPVLTQNVDSIFNAIIRVIASIVLCDYLMHSDFR